MSGGDAWMHQPKEAKKATNETLFQLCLSLHLKIKKSKSYWVTEYIEDIAEADETVSNIKINTQLK